MATEGAQVREGGGNTVSSSLSRVDRSGQEYLLTTDIQEEWARRYSEILDRFPSLGPQLPSELSSLPKSVLQEERGVVYEDQKFTLDVYCVYGLNSLSAMYAALLQKERQPRLIWIEDNRDELLRFCVSDHYLFARERGDEIYFLETSVGMEKLAKTIAERTLFRTVGFIESNNTLDFEELKKWVFYHKQGGEYLFSEVADRGIGLIEATLSHLTNATPLYFGSFLKDRLQGRPAIICGAGPSLKKNIDLLRGLEDRAFLFAGGNALPLLHKAGVTPHFGALIDPESSYEICKDAPLCLPAICYQSRIPERTLFATHAAPLLFPESSHFFFSKWLSTYVFKEREKWTGGWTVSNFLTQIALLFGCNPIIFLGMDLAFTEGDRYFGKRGTEIVSSKGDGALIEGVDICGNPILTRQDWQLSSEWTGYLAQSRRDHLFINATEGGLGLGKEVLNLSFQKTINTYLQEPCDLTAELHTELLGLTLQPQEEIHHQIKVLLASCKRCYGVCEKFLENSKNVYDEEKMASLLKKSLGKIRKEDFFVYVLEPLWEIWRLVLIREVREERSELPLPIRMELQELIFFHQTTSSMKNLS